VAVESGNLASGQVALNASSAVEVVPRSNQRRAVTVRNLDASITIFVGGAGVTAMTGLPLKPADPPIRIESAAPLHAIAASGTPSIGWLEET